MSAVKGDLLDRYVIYTSSYSNHDRILKAISYSFSLIAAILRTANVGKGCEMSEGLDKLYYEIGMTRCLTRFVGTTEALEALKNDSWAGSWNCSEIKPLARFQAVLMIFYHLFEHVGWAAYIVPKLLKVNGDWWFSRSCWFWTVYIVIDLYLCRLKLKELKMARRDILFQLSQLKDSSCKQRKLVELHEIDETARKVRLQVWRNVFYLPNCIHWSFIRPKLPRGVVASLGLAEAVVGIVQTFPRR